ncbi:hypothetical protein HMPREF9446_02022 [Bacteroides fluxus YIT 12057]|uniref:Uncharacterized protein n=1 Tax=Bacteroides fluxus YIT 12057 TaxID=763034 RepID=F3PTF4_9BACE|nr:hypothetical protein HMPREF9446_02022 [Bacteroides fluxus YIT 12057]
MEIGLLFISRKYCIPCFIASHLLHQGIKVFTLLGNDRYTKR